MKEEYVTHSQAKKLKKFGFDWDANKVYHRPSTLAEWELLSWYSEYKNWNNEGRFYLSAPTLSFAQKWLREVKEIDIDITLYRSVDMTCNPHEIKRSYEIRLITGEDYPLDGDVKFTTYELALSAGIDAALNLLTDKLK